MPLLSPLTLLLSKLTLSATPLALLKRPAGRAHLALDLGFAVVSLVGHQSLLGLGHFRDRSLLFIQGHWSFDPSRFGAWGTGLGFVIFVLVASHTNYWVHRFSHTVPFLWRLHKCHHSQTAFTGLSNYRAHPLETVLGGYATALVIALLCPFTSPWAKYYGYFIFGMGVLTHSELRTNFGVLEKVFITPLAHRAHHSLEPAHIDRNFGFSFSIWDRLYGTYVHVEPHEEFGLGIGEYAGLSPGRAVARSLQEPFVSTGHPAGGGASRASGASGASARTQTGGVAPALSPDSDSHP